MRLERTPDVVPLYHRVYVVLLQKILDGSFETGKTIPSEDELAASFSVSRITIRKAMERLEREGRIMRQRGRGTFPLPPVSAPATDDTEILRNQVSLAKKSTVRILEYGLVAAPAAVARQLDLAAGTPVLRIVRIRRDDRSAISHTTCYLPADLSDLVPVKSIGALPVSAVLRKAGVALRHFRERITAIVADVTVAGHLGVDVGAALIAMTRLARSADGRAIELLQALYRPDRYEYSIDYSDDGHAESTPRHTILTDSSH